jgi:uncharacterized membrane protein
MVAFSVARSRSPVRVGFVIAGVIVLALGLVLSFVPLIPAVSQSIPANTPRTTQFHSYEWNITGFSFTGKFALSLSWTSNLPVRTLIEVCSNGGINGSLACVGGGTPSWPGNGSGTSGSDSFSVVTNTTILIAMYGANGSQGYVTGHTADANVGLILLIVGIILLILGIVLKRKKKAQPVQPPPEPVPPST